VCTKVAERLVSICGTRFLYRFLLFCFLLLLLSFLTRHPVFLFPCLVPILCVPPQPPQKRCKLSQALICQLQLHARSSSLDSVYFQHLSTPCWKHLCLFGPFPAVRVLASLSSESLRCIPPLRPLLSTDFSSPSLFATDGRTTLRAAISNQPLRARPDL